ncbi:hypothetical protein HJG60_008429 [Phyllostomus discolor]|uniref:Uncharacterized protein n=1 Tax=Phyllostomus discolor TaxID=89673 RepID=A0A833Z4Z6_9CHIR|nr:hypothetical protein HJG60_008429 [Phyllostomus discolor]
MLGTLCPTWPRLRIRRWPVPGGAGLRKSPVADRDVFRTDRVRTSGALGPTAVAARGDAQAGVPGPGPPTPAGDGPFPASLPSLGLRTPPTACALDLRNRSRLPGNHCGPRSYPSAHAQRPSHALRV